MHWIKRKTPRPTKKLPFIARILRLLASATVAAWLQAIGAIVALFLTVSLAYQAQEDAKAKNIRLLAVYLEASAQALDNLVASCKDKNIGSLEVSLHALEDALDVGKQIQITELEAEDIATLVTLLVGLPVESISTWLVLSVNTEFQSVGRVSR